VRVKPSWLKLLWPQRESYADDPYWDFFINTPPSDLANTVTHLIRNAPEGNVFPTKGELHTPEITSSHVKGMARYFGADLVGIARLDLPGETATGRAPRHSEQAQSDQDKSDPGERYPFGVICVVRADYDTRKSSGIGGQVPVQNGLFITFVLGAWIRELGYRATSVQDPDAEALAAQAKLGTLNAAGRLVTRQFGANVHVANVIRTDLPLAADG
jgi:hypothetical protein